MSTAAIPALVAKLLLAAQGLTGYAAPAAAPEVAFLPHAELERRACNRPCAVYGWFPPGDTVYLDQRLDPLSDLRARAVLLHELVHFLQQENGAFPGPVDCDSWLAREHEAFEVERRWLLRQPAALASGALSGGPLRVPLKALCRDDAPPAAARAVPHPAEQRAQPSAE